MSTTSITRSPIPLTAAVAAFVAAVAFTGVALAQHNDGSSAPATTHSDVTYPVYRIERPWHSGVQPGMP
jgi:hypothetical protein